MPRFFSSFASSDGFFRRPAAIDPIGGGDPHAERLLLRPNRAHRLVHFEGKAHAIFERAAIFVGAFVGERRQELMGKIAVRAMQLDDIVADAVDALGGGGELVEAALDVVLGHRVRHRPAGIVGNGRRRLRRPAALLFGQDRLAAGRRRHGRAFASGMCELHAELGDAVLRQKSCTRLSASSLSSDHMPAHRGEMRPCGLTLVISHITSPAQPSEKLPRCIRCQSFAEPLSELYWHIGETTTRLGSVKPRIVIGENNTLVIYLNSRFRLSRNFRDKSRIWRGW